MISDLRVHSHWLTDLWTRIHKEIAILLNMFDLSVSGDFFDFPLSNLALNIQLNLIHWRPTYDFGCLGKLPLTREFLTSHFIQLNIEGQSSIFREFMSLGTTNTNFKANDHSPGGRWLSNQMSTKHNRDLMINYHWLNYLWTHIHRKIFIHLKVFDFRVKDDFFDSTLKPLLTSLSMISLN